jgi:tyrosinase
VPFTTFSSSLEGTPHGAVHVSVGGWMAVVPQAAQDPIYWLHHANIDRLWTLWLARGGGRTDPTTTSWLNRRFSFFNEGGTQVSMSAKQTLQSCQDLGYVYETVKSIISLQS